MAGTLSAGTIQDLTDYTWLNNGFGGTPTRGDIIYFNGTAWTKLPAGNTGQVLFTQGAGANPMWDDISYTVELAEQNVAGYTNVTIGNTFNYNLSQSYKTIKILGAVASNNSSLVAGNINGGDIILRVSDNGGTTWTNILGGIATNSTRDSFLQGSSGTGSPGYIQITLYNTNSTQKKKSGFKATPTSLSPYGLSEDSIVTENTTNSITSISIGPRTGIFVNISAFTILGYKNV